jgi:hypothetical protein
MPTVDDTNGLTFAVFRVTVTVRSLLDRDQNAVFCEYRIGDEPHLWCSGAGQ